jgi:hypothetical protein
MNNMNWKISVKNSFILLLTVLLSIQVVQSIGITRPIPYDLALMRGDTARFSFQLQATTSTNKIACTYSINGLESLEVKFDDEKTIVNAGGVADVYGTVTIPQSAPIGQYTGSLTARCGAYVEEGELSGSTVYQSISGPTFNVKVVELEEEKSIREVTEVKQQGIPYLAIITIIIVVIVLVIGVYYRYSKKGEIKGIDTSNSNPNPIS